MAITISERRARLISIARRYGIHVETYSPGDGKTRYRFFRSRKPVDYFGGTALYTALGLSEAEAWLAGYMRR